MAQMASLAEFGNITTLPCVYKSIEHLANSNVPVLKGKQGKLYAFVLNRFPPRVGLSNIISQHNAVASISNPNMRLNQKWHKVPHDQLPKIFPVICNVYEIVAEKNKYVVRNEDIIKTATIWCTANSTDPDPKQKKSLEYNADLHFTNKIEIHPIPVFCETMQEPGLSVAIRDGIDIKSSNFKLATYEMFSVLYESSKNNFKFINNIPPFNNRPDPTFQNLEAHIKQNGHNRTNSTNGLGFFDQRFVDIILSLLDSDGSADVKHPKATGSNFMNSSLIQDATKKLSSFKDIPSAQHYEKALHDEEPGEVDQEEEEGEVKVVHVNSDDEDELELNENVLAKQKTTLLEYGSNADITTNQLESDRVKNERIEKELQESAAQAEAARIEAARLQQESIQLHQELAKLKEAQQKEAQLKESQQKESKQKESKHHKSETPKRSAPSETTNAKRQKVDGDLVDKCLHLLDTTFSDENRFNLLLSRIDDPKLIDEVRRIHSEGIEASFIFNLVFGSAQKEFSDIKYLYVVLASFFYKHTATDPVSSKMSVKHFIESNVEKFNPSSGNRGYKFTDYENYHSLASIFSKDNKIAGIIGPKKGSVQIVEFSRSSLESVNQIADRYKFLIIFIFSLLADRNPKKQPEEDISELVNGVL